VKVIRDKTENGQAFLTIEMEPAEVEESLEKSYHRLVKRTNIPGFRRGKAPRAILEQYIGKESLLDDAISNLLPQAYEKALQEEEIEPVAHPEIEIAQTDPVIFKAVVPLQPTVKLGDYHHIKVEPKPVELAEDDVSAAIEQLRHQHAIWEPVERPVSLGDLVVLDIESHIEGEAFINQKGVQYQVINDMPFPAPGFAEQLLQMKSGEAKKFKLQFPSDYPKGELAGKEASFEVKVTEIKQEKLPELNDEFAKQINPDFESLDSLRERLSTNLRLKAEEEARIDFEQRVIDAVVDLAELEYPPILVEAEIDRIIKEQSRRWQMSDKGLEEYLRSINKTSEELREQLRPAAVKRVNQSLVLGKIAEEEKIEVSDSEINDEIENMTKDTTENKEKLNELMNTPQARQSIKQLKITRKTVERLVEMAKSPDTEVEVVKKEEQE